MQDMLLPIILYLLTTCLSTLLEQQAMGAFFDGAVEHLAPIGRLLPAAIFLLSTLFTVLLGSSWAMYALAFPVAVHLAAAAGISLPLCIGAVCAAGMAGEVNCAFTGDSLAVGNAIGCDPKAILKLRLSYGLIFTGICLLMYLAAGFTL